MRTRVSRLGFFRTVAPSIWPTAGGFSGLFRRAPAAAAGRRLRTGRAFPAAARPAGSRGLCWRSDVSAERAAAARVTSSSQNGSPSSAGAGPASAGCSRTWFRPARRWVRPVGRPR